MAFVENAVYHAFENKEEEWKIYINIKKDDDAIFISIIDNGCGFEIDKYLNKNYKNNNYGTIYSTLRRLYEFNRKFSGVKEKNYEIDSLKDKGTKVSILIPC